jgi:hexosaminidase
MNKFGWFVCISLITIVAVLVVPAFAANQTLPAPFKVLPQPREVELLGGAGLKFGDLKFVLLKPDVSRPVAGPILSCLSQTNEFVPGVLSLQLADTAPVPQSPEGYMLVVSKGKAEITSRGKAGLFYGCQTLEQLLEDARDCGTAIPACRIIDYPAMTYRAVQFDVKHHLDTMDYYYKSIDRLARYKINAVIFEFEDKLRYRSQPLIGAPHAISIEEMAAFTDYARDRNIDVSPLVQSLGHVTFILKHPQYAYLREDPNSAWTFCPMNEGTYQVIFDMYRDAIEATPGSKYLHVGGDETGNIGKCPRCKPMVEKEGVLGLNLYWFNRVNDFARQHGRTAIFWDDMIFEHSHLYKAVHDPCVGMEEATKAWEKGRPLLDAMVKKFPKDAYYMRWDYTMARHPGNIMALDWYKQSGLNAMICTAAQDMSVLYPRACVVPRVANKEFYDDRVDTIKSFSELAAEKGISGELCTTWDDSSPHFETFWRGIISSAEYGWNSSGRSKQDYEEAYWQREFGPECTGAVDLYAELYKAAGFWDWAYFSGEDTTREYSSPAEKERNIIKVPDLSAPGTWSKGNAERLQLAKKELERYEATSKQIADMARKARRNRYHFEILAATNDFQIEAAKLLVALEKCDTADKAQQKAGMKEVQTAIEYFDKSWENLKAVYAKTRFYAYPPNYVKGGYSGTWPDIPYLSAQREDLSWLIMPEQQYHKMVQDWMKANGD